jgi:outer membrane protein assembly factor BamB
VPTVRVFGWFSSQLPSAPVTAKIFAKSLVTTRIEGMKSGRAALWLVWVALLVGASSGTVRAKDGDLISSFTTGNTGTVHIHSSPAIDADGFVYIGVEGDTNPPTGRLVALDTTTHNLRAGWPAGGYSTREYIDSTPAISADGSTLYFGCWDGYLYAITTATGTLKWRIQLGNRITFSSPAIVADGTVYIGSGGVFNDGTSGKNGLHAVKPSADHGDLLWTFKTTAEVESSPSIAPDGTIYFGCDDNNIYALNPSDGSLKWSRSTVSSVVASPAIGSDGTVYVGSYDGFLYAMEPTKGGLNWKFPAAGAIESSPTIGPDGTIYFGDNGRFFYAL